MVWTPEQTGAFLDFVRDDWLCPLRHSFVFLGPRRGEMCALPWTEVSLTAPGWTPKAGLRFQSLLVPPRPTSRTEDCLRSLLRPLQGPWILI
ncbi:hypothetical protein StrepF001_33440 [Streptomyces sp. F001]|uniref:hypothetical protein n=1 Tax=Streptomyces sp. F001 TaxID=1510026 RepID=UPI00101E40C0|nr:hypothetical protein [Streptomyces sp. F001]RZB15345.1 hypothetical protein StrepF001_33440 [Streptomyces sp. F001]